MTHGDEKSSLSVMPRQCNVPCVGRARAREPHTRVPEEEDATRDCTRFVPLGKGRQRRAATDDSAQFHPSRKKEPDTSDHVTATRTTHNVVSHSLTYILTHSREGATRSAQHKCTRDTNSCVYVGAALWFFRRSRQTTDDREVARCPW